jgi:hypothetical protein
MARLQRQLFEQTIATTPLGLFLRAHAMFAEIIAMTMAGHHTLLQQTDKPR